MSKNAIDKLRSKYKLCMTNVRDATINDCKKVCWELNHCDEREIRLLQKLNDKDLPLVLNYILTPAGKKELDRRLRAVVL